MTLNEAAAQAGTTPDNLRGAIHRGTLGATNRGRDWDVSQRALDRYIRERLGKKGRAAGRRP